MNYLNQSRVTRGAGVARLASVVAVLLAACGSHATPPPNDARTQSTHAEGGGGSTDVTMLAFVASLAPVRSQAEGEPPSPPRVRAHAVAGSGLMEQAALVEVEEDDVHSLVLIARVHEQWRSFGETAVRFDMPGIGSRHGEFAITKFEFASLGEGASTGLVVQTKSNQFDQDACESMSVDYEVRTYCAAMSNGEPGCVALRVSESTESSQWQDPELCEDGETSTNRTSTTYDVTVRANGTLAIARTAGNSAFSEVDALSDQPLVSLLRPTTTIADAN